MASQIKGRQLQITISKASCQIPENFSFLGSTDEYSFTMYHNNEMIIAYSEG